MRNRLMELVLVGRVVKKHGIQGNLTSVFYAESYKNLLKYQKFYTKSGQELKIVFKSKPNYHITEDKNTNSIKLIVKINDIQDPNKADCLIGSEIYIDKNDIEIEKDEFLFSDLIGLEVFLYKERETKIGSILDVHDFGGGTILEIKSDIKEFKTFNMFIFNNENFPEINLLEKKIYFEPENSGMTIC